MKEYLAASEYIDWQHPEILAQARSLAKSLDSEEDIVRACFVFVRDQIKHSWDYRLNPVTVKASDVLKYGTGFCYAKSHLLAALLRAKGIPAALCYQRLTIDNDQPPYSLHGLNSVYLKEHGWYRIDARGNKSGVDAEFCPPREQLAYRIRAKGEADLPERYAEPLAEVVQALNQANDIDEVYVDLPDLEAGS